MNVVLDTNVLLSATLWDKSEAQKLLFTLIERNNSIYTSPEMLEEYKKVLKRDFEYTEEEITQILEKLLPVLTIIDPLEKIEVIKEDPDDNKIIECALEAKAQYIITYDKHLLHLGEYQSIKIRKPNEYFKS